MKCPECGMVGQTKIIVKKEYKWTIQRRRWCRNCDYRFNTYEATEEEYFQEVNRTFKKWTTGEEKTAVGLYMQGLSNREIGEKVGRSTIAIRKKIARLTKDGTFTDYLEELEG